MNAITVSNIGGVQIQTDSEFISRRQTALESAKEITTVSDEFTQSIAVESARELAGLSKMVEKSRTDFKAPILELGRAIDSKAKELVVGIELESKRINGLVTAFQDTQRRKAEAAERARLAEIRRIEDEQRKSAAAQEQSRIDAESAFTRKERTAAEEALRVEQSKQAELQRQSEAARASVTVAPAKVEGLVVKKVWRFEVVNLEMLCKQRRDLCKIEASISAINDAVRRGEREIPGLRIWEETKTEVRQ